MALVKFKRKSSDEIENLPIEDGALIYDYETGKTYMDYGEDRIPTGGGGSGSSDIIIIGDETEATEDTKLIIEDEDLDFQGSEIVNEESNSTQKGYSASYTNARNTYSTDEVFTGKYWIDGKKIYRKTFTFTTTSTANAFSSQAISLDNPDVIMIDDSHSYIYDNVNNTFTSLNSVRPGSSAGSVSNANLNSWFRIDKGNSRINYVVESNLTSKDCVVTLEYTKESE